jgi:hypothetical protein
MPAAYSPTRLDEQVGGFHVPVHDPGPMRRQNGMHPLE